MHLRDMKYIHYIVTFHKKISFIKKINLIAVLLKVAAKQLFSYLTLHLKYPF